MNNLIIFCSTFFGYICYSYDRKSISYTFPSLRSKGLISKHQAGLLISSQTTAYSISKFICGLLSDRLSPRLMLSIGLLISGVSTALFSTSSSISIFTVSAFINGLGQGFGWPACVKLMQNWFTPEQFGTVYGVLSSATNIALAFGPFVSFYIVTNYDWQSSLLASSSMSVLVGTVLYAIINDSPDGDILQKQHSCTIGNNRSTELKGWKSSYEQMFLSPIIWVVSFSYMVIFFTRTCCLEWAQMYLIEELSQNQLTANFFITGFETGGIAGGFLAGWASDWARTKLKIEGNKRMVVTIVLHVVLVLLLHFFLFNVTSSTSTVVFIFIGLMLGACIYGSIAIFGVVAVETVPPELSGTSHAVASLACNLGGIIGGLPVTLIASNYSWSFVFLILEIICVLSTSIMLLTRNTDRMPIKRD